MVSADRPAGAALASKNVALAVDGLENRERKRVLGTLEAYRGLAALVVVIIHGTSVLGSGLVDQSQKMTVAARAMTERKTIGHRS
jgi:hypothetical protein